MESPKTYGQDDHIFLGLTIQPGLWESILVGACSGATDRNEGNARTGRCISVDFGMNRTGEQE